VSAVSGAAQRIGRVAGPVLVVAVFGTMLAGCGDSAPPGGETPQVLPGQSVTVTYCHGEQAKITEPERPGNDAPAAVYLHGGSWISGDHTSGGFIIDDIGTSLNAHGFVTMAANYRLGPAETWPAQIVDAKCAVRYLRANAKALHVDPHRIGIWGHSAGAHLASLVGTAPPSAGWDTGGYPDESSRVEAVADLAGPSDLVALEDEGVPGQVKSNFVSLLGEVPANELPAELKAASPITYVSRGDPPFLIVHADNDGIVPLGQSVALADALEAARVATNLVVVHGGGHSLDEPGGQPTPKEIDDMVVNFFVKELTRPGRT
jgi:acetyl esterase/lipase